MLAGMRSKGMDPQPMLDAAGIPRTVETSRDARVPIAAYAALYNGVVRRLDDEGFALFSSPLRLGTFEFLCRGMLSSATLGEALDRAARFLRLVLADVAVGVDRDAAHARLVIAERRRLRPRSDDPARVFAFEWLLRLLHGLSCWLTARALPLDHVAFPYPRPTHAADYALIYTEHSTFEGERLVASMDSALLEAAPRRDERDLAAFLVDAPGKIAILYRRDREMARAVREVLSGSFERSLEEVAVRLNVSARTLHRRLRDEGTSFRQLKDRLRRDLALSRVEKSGRSIAEIAAELGYSEPSAFFRAFQNWTGEAPSRHRKRSSGNPENSGRRATKGR